ncbi:alpha/beta hydrolase fold-domain-containing protein [Cryomyces antarcticus]
MDGSPSAILKLLVPKIPMMLKTALWHSLWLSPTSTKWDLRTEITVNIIRSLMDGSNPSPMGKLQRSTIKDPGVKGKMWISIVTMSPPPEDDVRQALFKAIDDMKEGPVNYTQPEVAPVEAEWTGYRPDAAKDAEGSARSEEEKYERLMSDPSRKSEVTILYFHGGAYYLMDPSTHRGPTVRLAKETGGRCFSVRYRLAPQSAFPTQLLDGLVAYLSLLHPPPGSFHEPVPASQIVFAGDSAGGNLSFALLQLLLQLHRTKPASQPHPTIRFHSADVAVPLPAGVSANSGWFDITRSMPSLETNAHYDYLPPPSATASDPFPADDIWPTTPPRGDVFADLSLLCHPLVSPLAAPSWTGSPPLWIETGEEMLTDEDAFVAARAAAQGVTVVWEQYEAMPHCFAMMFDGLETSRRCMAGWGRFAQACVESPEAVRTGGTLVEARTAREREVDVGGISGYSFEEVRGFMERAREKRLLGWEREGKSLPKPNL